MDFANALMGEDCHSYLAEHPRTVYYIVLKIYKIAYLRAQIFIILCIKCISVKNMDSKPELVKPLISIKR